MNTEDAFVFCQSDLPSTSFAAFEDMRKRGQFCDLTIKVNNYCFVAHRVIVAAGIPYFESVLSNATTESEEKVIALEDIDCRALDSLLHFVYCGRVSITYENVQALLAASHLLKLNQVQSACIEFLSRRLRIDNVVQIRTLALNLDKVELVGNCNCYIRKNFLEFSKSEDFLDLSHLDVKEIISGSDLDVPSEEAVFESVMNWTKKLPLRTALLPELLNEVRLIYLPLDYLIKRVDTEELIKSSIPCRDLVNKVKNYHLLPKGRSEFSDLKTLPRNWTGRNLYAFCSCTSCGSSVYCFDADREVWYSLASKKVQYEKINGIALVGDKMYLFLDKTILTFDLKSHEWELLTQKCESIAGAAIVAYKNIIYCFGSKEDHFAVRCFDSVQSKWLDALKMQIKRYDAGAATLSEYIYVTGGYNENRPIRSSEKYCPSTGEWRDMAPMLASRDEHGCTSANGKIYVCGGRMPNGTTAEVYDPVIDQWKFITSMQNARNFFPLVSDHKKVYAFGKDNAEVYDPERDEWKSVFHVPSGLKTAISVAGIYI